MLQEPKCFTRKCKHYLGMIQPDGTEMTETNNCKAFLDGIPEKIAYGDDDHTKSFLGDNGIQFEEEK